MGWDEEEFSIKKLLFSKINRKLTLLFIIVAVIAPSLAIYYYYSISTSVLPDNIVLENSVVLETSALIIILIIAIDAGVIGFLVSRSITRPIKQLYNATKELEKGNLEARTNIHSGDEIEELGHAFNNTLATLSKIDEERKEMDNAKTEFLSITSHELRSPMTPMKAQLQMLENGYFGNLNDKQKNSLDIVIRNADRLDKIIVDFLEISRIEAARLRFAFRETDIAKLAEETVEFMNGFAKEKNITLVLKTDKLPVIEVDPDRVTQVLRNLINNAIKFSEKKSKIEINIQTQKDFIQFSVKDYGIGLSLENQVRIFEPFYQVEDHQNRKHGGTGLGLAICRGIVESQKGKIWLESKLGKGTTFYFTIPLKPVQEIQPIKVLFSPRSVIEKKLQKEFETILGPLGIAEFEELKNKNSLWKDDLCKYIDQLTEQYILDEQRGEVFKKKIGIIFGEEKELINKKKDTPAQDEVVKRD